MYLIPKPKRLEQGEGRFYVSSATRIVLSPQIGEHGFVYASILKECMGAATGFLPEIVKGKPGAGDIYLTLAPDLKEQEYRLTVTDSEIRAEGGDGAGVLYAAETLCQIFGQHGAAPECIAISDFPDVLHRGYFLDETRGRVLKLDALKKAVDKLCRYKINEFQLYVEQTYLFRDFPELWRDQTPLTAEEIIELDRYCAQRHVELIPSLASFGHLYALLSTKTCCDLCELEDSEKQPFSFLDRMRHHTINTADERALPLIEGMLEEYMALFTSDKFNICADETFDLGKGRSRALGADLGTHRLYIDFVKKLSEFVVKQGKTPMFWGDIICGDPQLIRELPKEILCLNWGYAPDQREEETRRMAEAGARQYLCPGVAGWNQWMNLLKNSYENIVRMCRYAQKYGAVGILNTDWGDFGHVNLPEYSVPGMIYGAAFSWNREQIPFEEINRQIARIEYHDTSERLVNLLAQLQECSKVSWWDAVMYYELRALGGSVEEQPDFSVLTDGETVRLANEKLAEILRGIKELTPSVDSRGREIISAYDMTICGIQIWNEIGACLGRMDQGADTEETTARKLAEQLERWFMDYRKFWRKSSKEGDLAHIGDIIYWYADRLRGRERWNRRDRKC